MTSEVALKRNVMDPIREKPMQLPKVGLVICNSGGSNSGTSTGMAAMKVVEKLGDVVGICSLPALVNEVSTQTALVKKIPHLIVIDGCRNECARKILKRLGIGYEAYINLEYDLGIRKLGPFTTLEYSEDDVERISSAITKRIEKALGNHK